MPIADLKFKQLIHFCKGYKRYSSGGKVESGYYPDYVLHKKSDFIILECENSSSRKTYVGAMIKAAHFLQGERTGILILVLVPRKNTTIKSIASHLKMYLKWIKDKTNLNEVWVIETEHYFDEENVIKINTRAFKKAALQVTL